MQLNKLFKKYRLKVDAFVYRYTGYYSNFARLCEYEHVLDNLMNSEWATREDPDVSIELHVGLIIGIWQLKHGFYRTYKIK